MANDVIVVRRAEIDLDEPWNIPAGSTPVTLCRATDSLPARLGTLVTASFDEVHLNIHFSAEDDHVAARHLEHDAPLYEEDVVEAFLAPENPAHYFELEVSPLGTVFDARIESPGGERATMRVDRDWNCEGLFAAVCSRTDANGAMRVDTLLRVPFASLGRGTPVHGESWRANFFRVDRHPVRGDEYTAWRPTFRQPPDFHVVAAFGVLRFEL